MGRECQDDCHLWLHILKRDWCRFLHSTSVNSTAYTRTSGNACTGVQLLEYEGTSAIKHHAACKPTLGRSCTQHTSKTRDTLSQRTSRSPSESSCS